MDVNSELKDAQLEILDADKAHSANTKGMIWFNRATDKIKAFFNSEVKTIATEDWVNNYDTTVIQPKIDAAVYGGQTTIEVDMPYWYDSSSSWTQQASVSTVVGENGIISVEIIPQNATDQGYIESNLSVQIRALVNGVQIGLARPVVSNQKVRTNYFKFFSSGISAGNATVTIESKSFFGTSGGYILNQGMKIVTYTY